MTNHWQRADGAEGGSEPRAPSRFGASWLLEHETRRYDVFGRREAIGSLIRWRNPDNRLHRDANHVAVPPGVLVTASELAPLLGRQAEDGATRCIDIYGSAGENDRICRDAGLTLEQPDAVLVMAWQQRSWQGRLHTRRFPVEIVPPEEWVTVQRGLHVDGLEPWGVKAAALESQIPNTTYYAARAKNRRLAAILRHDWLDISQLETLFTHAVYRGHGMASACLSRALEESRHDDVYLLVLAHNVEAISLYAEAGAEIVARDLVRRYVG